MTTEPKTTALKLYLGAEYEHNIRMRIQMKFLNWLLSPFIEFCWEDPEDI